MLQDEENTNIYIANLPLVFDESHLESLFGPFGEIESSIVMRDKHTKMSRGVGFIRMITRDSAELAIERLNGAFIPGYSYFLRHI
jgi:cold-inducible RNA-binding protein